MAVNRPIVATTHAHDGCGGKNARPMTPPAQPSAARTSLPRDESGPPLFSEFRAKTRAKTPRTTTATPTASTCGGSTANLNANTARAKVKRQYAVHRQGVIFPPVFLGVAARAFRALPRPSFPERHRSGVCILTVQAAYRPLWRKSPAPSDFTSAYQQQNATAADESETGEARSAGIARLPAFLRAAQASFRSRISSDRSKPFHKRHAAGSGQEPPSCDFLLRQLGQFPFPRRRTTMPMRTDVKIVD
ncbi:hypothetical protein HMPREF0972_01939 [Actinomyces sp. oral taxon 848 str. F0332]|nr:hypothetical protein HMPREF0972_01939 [Actinomyces sp. oral taxon 848 str. F0332]